MQQSNWSKLNQGALRLRGFWFSPKLTLNFYHTNSLRETTSSSHLFTPQFPSWEFLRIRDFLRENPVLILFCIYCCYCLVDHCAYKLQRSPLTPTNSLRWVGSIRRHLLLHFKCCSIDFMEINYITTARQLKMCLIAPSEQSGLKHHLQLRQIIRKGSQLSWADKMLQ